MTLPRRTLAGAAVALLALVWLSPRPLMAGPGTSALTALQLGQGIRAAGFGGAYVALTADPAVVYYNPAGLGGLEIGRAEAAHEFWYGEVQRELGSVAVPLGPGGFALSAAYLHVPGFVGYDAADNPIGEVNAATMVAVAGYGLKPFPRLSVGLSTALYSQRLDDVSATGVAFTVGTQWELGRFTLGGAVRNLGPSVGMQTTSEPLPTLYALGVSWRAPFQGLGLAAEFDLPQRESGRLRFGAEYATQMGLAVRTGYSLSGDRELDAGSDLVVGAGFKVGAAALDYAYTVGADYGALHRIGLSWQLGSSGP